MKNYNVILKSIAISMLLICFNIVSVYSQDIKTIQEAMSKSYTYETSAQYSKAIEEVKKIYSECDYYTNMRLGWLTYLSGQYTESIKYYQIACKIMPMAVEAKLGLTYPASANGNLDLVKSLYLEVLSIDDKNKVSNYNLGLILYNKKDYKGAYDYFAKVSNLYPFDYNGLLMFGWVNFKLEKLREAKVIFNKVLVINPYDKSATEGLSYIK